MTRFFLIASVAALMLTTASGIAVAATPSPSDAQTSPASGTTRATQPPSAPKAPTAPSPPESPAPPVPPRGPEPLPDGVTQIIPRGVLASVDEPVFVPAAGAGLPDSAWVLGVYLDGEARAYSLNLLNRHEVVNDRIGDTPLAAVW